MSRRPVLEDVNDDDIDNLDMDIAEFDPNLKTPIAPKIPEPSIVRSQDQELPLFPQIPINNQPPQQSKQQIHKQNNIIDPKSFSQEEEAEFKKFQIVYPCYFDLNRSHKQGRKVNIDRAVENPLAKTISDACQKLRLPVLLELDKTHPQDFGNPGRVRVLLKNPKDNNKPVNSQIQNKRTLYNKISDYLVDHPTDLDSVGAKSGIKLPSDLQSNFKPDEIPKVKGFKMNTIVPIHSPLTMKHPMTKSIYDPEPETETSNTPIKPNVPKQPKKKIMRLRG
ncbi:SEC65 [Candida pseudojiufengensis]|uniref:SEC65 n=1 Tax=Candida pseudojiufengensis TaxID=497109 RepID=UPI0022240F8C|nr:SEC65 [Candida pseudojiufengensis]KAI5966826.1 SEC65 [Candida pseudojiufengensis]